MWTLAPMIAFAAEIHQGVGLRSLMTFMVGFNPLLVFVASFVNTKATWKLTKFDFACGVLSLLGLLLWLLSGQGNIAILFSIVADALAALPTIVKSYSHPESESWLVFLGGGLAAGITLLTIKAWTFANYGFPLYILLVCLVLISLIRFKFGKRLNSISV
jgi:hypothetical protein